MIDALASIIPAHMNLADERAVLAYLVTGGRCGDYRVHAVLDALPEIIGAARRLRRARAA